MSPCSASKKRKQESVSQDAKYCASLIQFQDYAARQAFRQQRLNKVLVLFRVSEEQREHMVTSCVRSIYTINHYNMIYVYDIHTYIYIVLYDLTYYSYCI